MQISQLTQRCPLLLTVCYCVLPDIIGWHKSLSPSPYLTDGFWDYRFMMFRKWIFVNHFGPLDTISLAPKELANDFKTYKQYTHQYTFEADGFQTKRTFYLKGFRFLASIKPNPITIFDQQISLQIQWVGLVSLAHTHTHIPIDKHTHTIHFKNVCTPLLHRSYLREKKKRKKVIDLKALNVVVCLKFPLSWVWFSKRV